MAKRFDIDSNVGRQEWLDRSEADLDCSVFQTPFWGDVVLRSNDATSIRVSAARFLDGATLLLPLGESWRSKRTGLASFESMPTSVYGGPIICGTVAEEDVCAAIKEIALSAAIGAESIAITSSPRRVFRLSAPFSSRTLYAHVLDISASDWKTRYSDSLRRDIKIAQKSGVRVRFGNSIDDLSVYFSIYEDSLKRWGETATSRHSKDLFLSLSCLPYSSFRVWIGEVDSVPVAGLVMLYKGSTAYYWHGAFLSDFSKLMPSKIVLDAAVTDAADRGYLKVDMLSSGGHLGVVKLKESMGALPEPFLVHQWTARGTDRLVRAVRHGLARYRPW